MRRMMLGAILLGLAGCGSGNQEAVGANSPDSIVTTATGNIVGTIPNESATADNATTAVTDDALNAADSMATPDGMNSTVTATTSNEM